jgi:hypothetical protein
VPTSAPSVSEDTDGADVEEPVVAEEVPLGDTAPFSPDFSDDDDGDLDIPEFLR